MPLVFRYGGAGTIWTPAGDLGNAVVRYQTPTMTHNAEVGDTATSSLELDDPAGVLQFTGLYHVAAVETSAPSNNQLVWSGVITGEHVKRADSLRTGQARRWLLDVTDENGGLGARILTDASANRPAETAGDRLRYLLSLSKAIFNPFDFGHVTYPTTQLDATDYRGQKAKDLLADCAVHSGYNFWCDYNEAHQTTELFFLNPDSTAYSSTLRISNLLSDVDSTTTFAPYEDATLDRSPSRIAYGVYMPYNGGAVYVTNEATGQAFAHQDQAAPMANVSTAATATTLATKFLNDNNEEDDRISTAILVPPAHVNDVRAGQKISAKFTHLPSYGSNFSSFRVLQRTVIQEADTEYRIALQLSPCSSLSCPTSLSGRVSASITDQAANGGYTVSLSITPTASSIVIGGFIASNSNVPTDTALAGTGSTLTLDAANVPSGHPATAHVYRAVGSGSTTLTGAYSPGFGESSNTDAWAGVGVAIATAATSPVQHKSATSVLGTCSVTLTSSPTAGNILSMVVGSRSSSTSTPPGVDAGWTFVASAQNGLDSVWLYLRCVANGDGSSYGTTSNQSDTFVSVAEWEIL